MSALRGAKPSALVQRDVAPPGQVIEAIAAPADLSRDAVPVWEAVVPWLCQRGALEDVDMVLLVELVELIGRARQYRHAIDTMLRNKWLVLLDEDDDEDVDGETVRLDHRYSDELLEALALASPRVKRLRSGYVECMRGAISLASSFGLTPTDRMRLGLTAGGEAGASLGEIIAAAMAATATPTTAAPARKAAKKTTKRPAKKKAAAKV